MTWSESISAAISYIEDHLAEPLSVEEIARAATLSPFYFQRGFAMLCGMSVGEYIRKRRLSQAGLRCSRAIGRSSISRWILATIRRMDLRKRSPASMALLRPRYAKAAARSFPLRRL